MSGQKVVLKPDGMWEENGEEAARYKYPVFYTGSNQRMVGIHNASICFGRPCVIHNPSDHHMRDWVTHWNSETQMMERICPHGQAHPDPDDLEYHKSMDHAIPDHICDGCCKT